MTIDERINEALRRLMLGLAPMRIPADPCDSDLVLASAHRELTILRARVAELERERDALAKRVSDLEYHLDSHVRATDKAQADAARLREVLAQVRDAMLATGQGPDGDDDPRRPVATAVWRALASAPSAEATL